MRDATTVKPEPSRFLYDETTGNYIPNPPYKHSNPQTKLFEQGLPDLVRVVVDPVETWLRTYRLIGEPVLAAQQILKKDKKTGNTYYAPSRHNRPVDEQIWLKHCREEITFVFCTVKPYGELNINVACYICFDIDRLFDERREILRKVLQRYGWDIGMWTTTGSRKGRGKVFLSVTPMEQYDANALGYYLRDECRKNPRWGHEVKAETTIFPQEESGGIVRILGRNLQRPADSADVQQDQFGQPTDLRYVVPITIDGADESLADAVATAHKRYRFDLKAESGSTLAVRLNRLLQQEVYVSDNSAWKDIIDVGMAAVIEAGKEAKAFALFQSWLDQILLSIPLSREGTRKQIESHTTRCRAWDWVCKNASGSAGRGLGSADGCNDFEKLSPEDVPEKGFYGKCKPSAKAWLVYNAIADLVKRKRWFPHAIDLGYRDLQSLLPEEYRFFDPGTIRYWADTAEHAGLLFRLQRGEGHPGGFVTLWTLHGKGQTSQEMYDKGRASSKFIKRVELGLPEPVLYVKDNMLVIPAKKVEPVLAEAA